VPISARSSWLAEDARSGWPFKLAPSPSAALHTRPESGSTTAPASGTPSRVTATETEYQGNP
jgi:hypothetical protein